MGSIAQHYAAVRPEVGIASPAKRIVNKSAVLSPPKAHEVLDTLKSPAKRVPLATPLKRKIPVLEETSPTKRARLDNTVMNIVLKIVDPIGKSSKCRQSEEATIAKAEAARCARTKS